MLPDCDTGRGQKAAGRRPGKPPCLLLVALYLFQSAASVVAQPKKETHWGAAMSLEVEKGLNRFLSVGIEEEIRLAGHTGLERSLTAVGFDFSLFRKIKMGSYYACMYVYNSKHLYEPRHRYYLNLSYRETAGAFTFSWRGRFQGTYRNENRGAYKINPKYAVKNKLEVDYTIWGLPWKPYLSCDFSTRLNGPVAGCRLVRLRYQGGTTWRLNRTNYLEFFLRFDHNLAGDDDHIVSFGITFRTKFNY